MPTCKGLHCSGCGRGSHGGLILAAVILFAVIAGSKTAGHVLSEAVHLLVIAAATLAAVTVTTVVAVLGVRRHRASGRRALQTASASRAEILARVRVVPAHPRPEFPAPSYAAQATSVTPMASRVRSCRRAPQA